MSYRRKLYKEIPNSIPLKDFVYSETYVMLTSVWILWYTMVKKY